MVFSGINSSRSTATHTKNLKIDGEEISEVSKTKFLGVIIDNKLKWQHHIAYISSKISKEIGIIIKARKFLSTSSLRNLYYSFIYPYLVYCKHVWGNASLCYLNKLSVLQKKAIRIIAGVRPRTSTHPLFQELKVLNLHQLNVYLIARLMYKVHTADIIDVIKICLWSIKQSRPKLLASQNINISHFFIRTLGK